MQVLHLRGQSIPSVGFGTWRLYGDACVHAVRTALDVGYRHIDTAQLYENEFQVGDAVKESGVSRESLFVATKVSAINLNLGHAAQSVENSLRRLGCGYIDLVMLHAPPDGDVAQVLAPLEVLRARGDIRHIGLSNFYGPVLERACSVTEILLHQFEAHPYVDISAVYATTLRLGVGVTAYCPLARGKILNDQAIAAVAQKHGKTSAQITLRWLLQHKQMAVVPKAASAERIKENFDVFDFALDGSDMQVLSSRPKDGRIIKGSWLPENDTLV